MKIQLVSDAHLGYGYTFDVLNPEADVFVIAGDFVSKPELAKSYFENFRKNYSTPVLYVLGNHEYYDLLFDKALKLYRNALKGIPDVHLLEKDVIEIDGINFLGTTLWSDLSDPMAALTVQRELNDYQFIKRDNQSYINTTDTHNAHKEAVKWLDKELKQRKDETNVVITHHAPCWECRNKYFDYDSNSRYRTQGFCNRLDTLIDQNSISHWFYGHTHKSYSFRIKNTRIMSNQVGFGFEKKFNNYNRYQIIEVDNG